MTDAAMAAKLIVECLNKNHQERDMNDTIEAETLLTLTADIVSAHVSHNAVGAGELPDLIASVHRSLASLGQSTAAAESDVLTPAVSVRSSVKRDHVVCLECGAKMKVLRRHLATEHQLSPEDYRARWKLTGDYPLVAPDYAEMRKAMAKKIGLGRKPKTANTVAPVQQAAAEVAAEKPARKKLAIRTTG